jgi:hypothetical protein
LAFRAGGSDGSGASVGGMPFMAAFRQILSSLISSKLMAMPDRLMVKHVVVKKRTFKLVDIAAETPASGRGF